MLDNVASDKPSNRPKKIGYQKALNPYKYLYVPGWIMEVKKSYLLICYACVRDMIEHIVSETKRVFKGKTHKNSCFFIMTPCH